MKSILLSAFLCLSLLAAPSTTQAESLSLPKDYLGWWDPYSRTTNDYGIYFLPNGTAYYQHREDKSYKGLMNYGVLDVSDQSVFLIVYNAQPKISYESTYIWELSQRDEHSLRFLTRKKYDCGLTFKDFVAYLEKPAITSLPESCRDYKNISYSSFTAYARDK